jgi:hypothetical protein
MRMYHSTWDDKEVMEDSLALLWQAVAESMCQL